MKEKLLFITLFVAGIIFTSCSDDIEYTDKFRKSYHEWLRFKSKSGNSYEYTTRGYSWIGISWETTITVNNGEVIQRSFKSITQEQEYEEIEEWTENRDELNTHKNTSASGTLTLDEIYDKAKNEWLKKRKDVETFFEAKNDGMISSCGYVPIGCMDDCFTGIYITNIQALK